MYKKINVSLNSDLRKRYGLRSFPIADGDIVKIRSGSRKGEGGKVVAVDHATGKISVEGITIAKADGKQKEFYLNPSNLVITRLDFSRQERLDRIRKIAAMKKITIVEPTPEELAPPPAAEPESAGGETVEAQPVESETPEETQENSVQEEEAESEDDAEEESQEDEEEEDDDQ